MMREGIAVLDIGKWSNLIFSVWLTWMWSGFMYMLTYFLYAWNCGEGLRFSDGYLEADGVTTVQVRKVSCAFCDLRST